MIKYREEMIRSKVIDAVVCDVCKKEFSYLTDHLETQEFQHIQVRGGFGSVFGDGSVLKADICQHCFKDKFGRYLIEDEDVIV